MSKSILKELHERIIKTFLDVIIMSMLRKAELSGYDIITATQTKYGFLPSSGTVYSKLYSLERGILIKGAWTEEKDKRTYKLTDEGQKAIKAILASEDPVKSLLSVLGINQA